MSQIARMKHRLASLTGLRGIAALWVLAYHTMLELQHLDPELARSVGIVGRAGYLGVDLFFVLSGFVIAYNYSGTPEWTPKTYAAFLWRRLARIYPVHLAGLALFGVFVLYAPAGATVGPHTLAGLLRSITLTHAWSIPVTGTWNVPSWSVSLEWAAYLVFPIVAAAAMKPKSAATIIGLVLLLFSGLFLVAISITYPGTMAYGVFRISAEFTAGVLLFRLWSLRRDSIASIGGIVALATFIGICNGFEFFIGKKSAFIYLPAATAAVVYGLACAPSALGGSVVQHLGKISYSLYIVHYATLHFARVTVQSHALAPAWMIAGSVAAVGLAHCCYRFLEQPARAWMVELARGEPESQVLVPK
jgi:peptidoglycan/LPS O-acetylase OafA/YrhL